VDTSSRPSLETNLDHPACEVRANRVIVMQMRAIETDLLTFDLPSDWNVFPDGKQIVAQGPHGEELIVSKSRTIGSGTDAEQAQVMESVKSWLLQSMRRAAAHPDLKLVAPESEQVNPLGVRLLRSSSITHDSATRFEQFGIIFGPEAVLLTYEAPADASRSLTQVTQLRVVLDFFGGRIERKSNGDGAGIANWRCSEDLVS
jgi:hypothetical protein